MSSRGSWTALFLCNSLAVSKCLAPLLIPGWKRAIRCLSLATSTCREKVEWQVPDSLRHSAALLSLCAAKPQHQQHLISRVTLACLLLIRLPLDVYDLLSLCIPVWKVRIEASSVPIPCWLGSHLSWVQASFVVLVSHWLLAHNQLYCSSLSADTSQRGQSWAVLQFPVQGNQL